MNETAAEVLAILPKQLNCVLLYRGCDRDPFELLSEDFPNWFREIFGGASEATERSAFLGDFVEHRAAEHWASGTTELLASGFWEEGDGNFFEAQAWRESAKGVELLLIRSVNEQARTQQSLIQRNHEQVLDRRRLLREIEKKEILLDCIVHDMSGPVGTLIMNLEHLGRKLSDVSSLRPAVDRALAQAKRQLNMVRSISQLFESDISAGDGTAGADGLLEVVDIVAVAHEMIDLHRPGDAHGADGCRMQFRLNRGDSPSMEALRVVGSEAHLGRVVENLLLNSLRYVPAGKEGEIIVSVDVLDENSDGRGQVEVRVEDNGPGVDPELAGVLFRPFSQGGSQPGQSGLGLYFCRIAVEQCRGRIGYRDRGHGPGTGACFWFRLPRVAVSEIPGRPATEPEEKGGRP